MSDEMFQSADHGDVVVVTPLKDMGEFELAQLDVPVYPQLLALTEGRHVVIDLGKTDYFGSSTIGIFIRLVNHAHEQGKKIAFCRLSKHENELVDITHMADFWHIEESVEDAVAFVRGVSAGEAGRQP